MTDADQLRPRILRSFAHRPPGEPQLPDEGRLAPFDGATAWLNSEPLTPEGLRGRVVLVDFWTYTCINWLRTAPYVRAWAAKYGTAGLTVVGVHTPEFGFEHRLDNVTAQTRNLGVEFPVAVDNDYAVWGAFANHYWPAVYLADAEGRIRYHHYGEGDYAMTEMAIQQLLSASGGQGFDPSLVTVEAHGLEVEADWRSLSSPETYLGYGQSSGWASERRSLYDAPHVYSPEPLELNQWDLSGDWTVARHAAVLNAAGGGIAFRFRARDVNLVMGPVDDGAAIGFEVLLDGAPAGDDGGTDVDAAGRGTVRDQNTYQLIRQPGPIGERLVEIRFDGPGVEAYCFTFG